MNPTFHEIGHSYVHQTTAYSNNHQSWKKKRENMKKKHGKPNISAKSRKTSKMKLEKGKRKDKKQVSR